MVSLGIGLNLFKLITDLLGVEIVFAVGDFCDGLFEILESQGVTLLASEESLTFIDPARVLFHVE